MAHSRMMLIVANAMCAQCNSTSMKASAYHVIGGFTLSTPSSDLDCCTVPCAKDVQVSDSLVMTTAKWPEIFAAVQVGFIWDKWAKRIAMSASRGLFFACQSGIQDGRPLSEPHRNEQ
jgi:hypothetical protein